MQCHSKFVWPPAPLVSKTESNFNYEPEKVTSICIRLNNIKFITLVKSILVTYNIYFSTP